VVSFTHPETPGNKNPVGTHWIGGWGELTAGLDGVTRRKNFQLLPRIEP